MVNDFAAVKRTEHQHKCKQCNYSTSKKSHLNKHLMKHSGEKPNKCKQCNPPNDNAICKSGKTIHFYSVHRAKQCTIECNAKQSAMHNGECNGECNAQCTVQFKVQCTVESAMHNGECNGECKAQWRVQWSPISLLISQPITPLCTLDGPLPSSVTLLIITLKPLTWAIFITIIITIIGVSLSQLEKVFLPSGTVFLRRNFPNIEEEFS